MITTTATKPAEHQPSAATLDATGFERAAAPAAPYSPRERQIVAYIAAGCSNQEIANSLGLRIQTVKNHLCRIYRKQGVPNRVQLAVLAVGQGAVDVRS